METMEDRVEAMWDREASSDGIYATPQLNLSSGVVERFASGHPDAIPEVVLYPTTLLKDIKDKMTLCLASGGGQQTAVLGLLGARVTCVDISEKQLTHDRVAARHYGYEVTTIKADMRDLSAFPNDHFDLVYQPVSACFIPDLKPLYEEVYRVLRRGGQYCVQHCNPATYPASFDGGANGWDGQGYRIVEPYRGGPILVDSDGRENMTVGELGGEYRHLLTDIYGYLIRTGFVIEDVVEDPRHCAHSASCEPGSYGHFLSVVAEHFAIVCRKT